MTSGPISRSSIRRYFGETEVEPCGQCDLCLTTPEARDATEHAQKALSAIHRLGGRYGRGRVVDHLLGKAKQAGPGEEALSTFGVGADLGAPAWRDLLDQLLFEGVLREDPNDGRPLIGLGDPEGVRAIYRGERRVKVREFAKAPVKAPRGSRSGGAFDVPPQDRSLFDALRAWRKAQAVLQAVPPYVIFHDRTLIDIAGLRPRGLDDLGAVNGVGQAKLDRYGDAVLKVVREN